MPPPQDNNVVHKTWAPEGVIPEKKECLSHHEVLQRLDGYDPERGAKVAGHRGYFLRKWGVFLSVSRNRRPSVATLPLTQQTETRR